MLQLRINCRCFSRRHRCCHRSGFPLHRSGIPVTTEQSQRAIEPHEAGRRSRHGGNELPVALIAEGNVVRIAGLSGGGHFKKRLMALGMIPGEPIKVIKNSGSGPVILETKDARMAIGRGEALMIAVRETRPRHGIAGKGAKK